MFYTWFTLESVGSIFKVGDNSTSYKWLCWIALSFDIQVYKFKLENKEWFSYSTNHSLGDWFVKMSYAVGFHVQFWFSIVNLSECLILVVQDAKCLKKKNPFYILFSGFCFTCFVDSIVLSEEEIKDWRYNTREDDQWRIRKVIQETKDAYRQG